MSDSKAPSPANDVAPAETLTFDPPANQPSITQYDPLRPFFNQCSLLLNRMSPLGRSLMAHDRSVAQEAHDCERCESQVSHLLSHSPIIRFLRGKINNLGSDVDESKIFCRRCPILWNEKGEPRYQSAGGVSMAHGIQVCANFVRSRDHMETLLAHEMVHVWDGLRWEIDEQNLRHIACMEIRASALSGECRWTKEFWMRNNWKLTQQHQDCVRRRAVMSVTQRPNCQDPGLAARIIDEVWDSCYKDTRPFDEIYK